MTNIETQPLRLDAMRGNEHVKRAIEVASVSNTPIVFSTHRANRATAENYAQWLAQTYGNTRTWVLETCYCGNFGSVYETCKCSERAITRWRNRPEFQDAQRNGELWSEVAHVPFEKLASARRPESDETVMQRVNRARTFYKPAQQVHELDQSSIRLMQAAMRQLMLSEHQVQQVMNITASIVALNDGKYSVACLAEALQYRMR